MKCWFFSRSRVYAGGTYLLSLVAVTVLLSAGCASEVRAKRFNELLQLYPGTQQSLNIRPLPDSLNPSGPQSFTAVTIVVHPGYALFFRNEKRNTYSEAKYDLLEYQLFEETRYIREAATSGTLLILVLPGNFEKDSIAPSSYISYLNSMVGASATVYYIRSETTHSGVIPLATTVKLHGFLRNVRADKILLGGGFIGRCQGEFYKQFTTYVEHVPTFIVPEISTLSPDDISSSEARDILAGIRKNDYHELIEIITSSKNGEANTLSLNPLPSR